VTSLTHVSGGIRPACAWTPCRANDEPTRLGLEFDFARQLGLFQQRSRNPDALRVPDSHDARFGGHVITL